MAGVFQEGSHFLGTWDKGSTIRFLGPGEDGDVTSDVARQISGTGENYTFTESDGVTTVDVEMDSADEYAAMFTEGWPRAPGKLKELSEARR